MKELPHLLWVPWTYTFLSVLVRQPKKPKKGCFFLGGGLQNWLNYIFFEHGFLKNPVNKILNQWLPANFLWNKSLRFCRHQCSHTYVHKNSGKSHGFTWNVRSASSESSWVPTARAVHSPARQVNSTNTPIVRRGENKTKQIISTWLANC